MQNKKLIALLSITTPLVLATVLLVIFNPFKSKEYKYYIVSFETNGGTPIESISVKEGTKIKKPSDPNKEGYSLRNWSIDDYVWDFDKDVVNSDITLSAKWNLINYSITYNFNGGYVDETMPSSYTILSDFELKRATKQLSVFGGWFNQNGNRIDAIVPGMTGDLFLGARWIDNLQAISLDETKGNVLVFASDTQDNVVTVVNEPVDFKYHLFTGWYNSDNELLSTDTEYTFELNPNVTNYIYAKYMNSDEENAWNNEHGVNPILHSEDTTYVTYGMYPQTNVSDSSVINTLSSLKPTKYSNYYYFNHEYYVKKRALLARDWTTGEYLDLRCFDNGDAFTEDQEYWFKVEPIKWTIISNQDDSYLLLSERLIDVQQYHNSSETRTIDGKEIMPNNYKHSALREWLNDSFLNQGFSFNSDMLNTINVDNSKETTATPDSGFECENTYDKITLLSYADYCNEELGFSSAKDREFLTTDYTRVSNANYSTDTDHPYTGYCWTRSPIKTEENNGYCVSRNNKNGSLNSDYVGFSGSCVQPVIEITLS